MKVTSRLGSSISARANILGKLKQQVKGADYNKLPIEQAYDYPENCFSTQLNQFVELLESNHAQVIKLSKKDIAEVVLRELTARNLDSLLHGAGGQYSEYIDSLASTINLTPYDFMIEDNKSGLFNDYPASITGSHCAIAQTGSIVLWPNVQEPRTLSLVPPVHFVIVDSHELYQDFATLISAQKWQDKLPTNVVLISGPSKTADIQQTLAYGAHGPKELIVLLLQKDADL